MCECNERKKNLLWKSSCVCVLNEILPTLESFHVLESVSGQVDKTCLQCRCRAKKKDFHTLGFIY